MATLVLTNIPFLAWNGCHHWKNRVGASDHTQSGCKNVPKVLLVWYNMQQRECEDAAIRLKCEEGTTHEQVGAVLAVQRPPALARMVATSTSPVLIRSVAVQEISFDQAHSINCFRSQSVKCNHPPSLQSFLSVMCQFVTTVPVRDNSGLCGKSTVFTDKIGFGGDRKEG